MMQTQTSFSLIPRIAVLSLAVFMVACGGSGKSDTGSVQASAIEAEVPADVPAPVIDGIELSVEVVASPAVNQTPLIYGEPLAVAVAGQLYSFSPAAQDPEGDALSYTVENLPAWASFNRANGRLYGTPDSGDVGYYSGITISVSDGNAVAPMESFDVEVEAAPKVTRKSNPGHYIAMVRSDNQNDMIDSLRPGVRGILKRYYWKDFEPTQGQYDFSELESDLDLLAAQGGMLVVFVEDKTFNGEIPTPGYLRGYTVENRNRGYTVIRWDPFVVERFKKLLTELGKRFDSHPAFEGMAIQESSPSLNADTLALTDYTPEKYRDAIIDVLTTGASSAPSSTVFWYMNFLPQRQEYLVDIANAVAEYGVAVGGPDVLPDDWSLNRHAYPMYDELKGKVTLFNSMQFNSYNHVHKDTSYPTKYWTMNELFRFARNELHVNYLFWNRKTWRSPGDSYTWDNALPTIANNPAINP